MRVAAVRVAPAGISARRPGRAAAIAVAALVALAATGCASAPRDQPLSAERYRAEMAAACATTRVAVAGLPAPPDGISTTDFTREVARLLRTEADTTRALRPPDELDADHRSFVQNTDDQATAWSALADATAAAEGGDELGAARTRVAELTLGRDDLAATMGLDGCRADDSPTGADGPGASSVPPITDGAN